MDALFVRHCAAVDPHEASQDELRWLSASGRAHAARAFDGIRAHVAAPTRLYTSPLVRAVQTAEFIAAATAYPGEIVALEALSPDGYRPERVDERIARAADDDVLVFVGHEPTIRWLTARVAGLDELGPFATGAVAHVRLENGRGRFLGWRTVTV